MKDSGMVSSLSDFFVNISNETTFPIFTFISRNRKYICPMEVATAIQGL